MSEPCATASPPDDQPDDARCDAWLAFDARLTQTEQLLAAEDEPALADALHDLYQDLLQNLLPATQQRPASLEAPLARALNALQERAQKLRDDSPQDAAEQARQMLLLQLRLAALMPLSLLLNGHSWNLYQDVQQQLETLTRGNAHAKIPAAAREQQRQRLAVLQDELLCQRMERYIERMQALTAQPPVAPQDSIEQSRAVTRLWQRIRFGEQLMTHVREQLTRLHSKDTVAKLVLPSAAAAPGSLPATLQRMDQLQHRALEQIITLLKRMPRREAQHWLAQRQGDLLAFADEARHHNDQLCLDIQVYELRRAYLFLQRFRSQLLIDEAFRHCVAYAQLLRAERRLHNEWVEKGVSAGLAQRFGEQAERRLDLAALLLVTLAIVLLALDLSLNLDTAQRHLLTYIDIGICLALLSDFSLRIAQAPDRLNYLRRHWFTDLLPAIPFSGLTLWFDALTTQAESTTLIRGLRVANVYLKKARPLIRLGRIFIFALRGMDRLVRMHRHLLNWDIEFSHTAGWNTRQQSLLQARRLRHSLQQRREALLQQLDDTAWVAARQAEMTFLTARMSAIRSLGSHLGYSPQGSASQPASQTKARTVKVDWVIENLLNADAEMIGESLGDDFPKRLQRLSWLAAMPPLRWLPIFSDLLLARRQSRDAAAFAEQAAQRIGQRLRWLHERILFFSDLQGVVTAPQLVDRIGATLIESMRRPRNRLLLLGFGFVLMTLLIEVLPFDWLEATASWLRKTLAWPVLFFGLIALLAVSIGGRLRRMAQTNTDFYARVAEARSIGLLNAAKQSRAEADQTLFCQRVIAPENRLRGTAVHSAPPSQESDALERFRAIIRHGFDLQEGNSAGTLAERIFLLYRDYLRGTPFHRSDTNITDQLLGDPALQHLRQSLLESDSDLQHELNALDLGNRELSSAVLWQRMITQAITQRTGQLVDEYNRHVLPLRRRQGPGSDPQEVRRFQDWLQRKQSRCRKGAAAEDENHADNHYVTTTFTALDFLSTDPARAAAVERRFGGEIVQLIAHERRRMIREVFGVPFDHAPLQISFNPYKMYWRYLSAGRIFLLPLTLIGAAWRLLVYAVRWLMATLRELSHPQAQPLLNDGGGNDYPVALRKLHRMCKHLFLAAARLRALFDVEYLGLALPGENWTLNAGETLRDDLDRINATTQEREAFVVIEQRGAAALAEWQQYLRQQGLEGDSLSRRISELRADLPAQRHGTVKRALMIAYLANHLGLRDLVQGAPRLCQLARQAIQAKGRLPRHAGLWSRLKSRLPATQQEQPWLRQLTQWWRLQSQEWNPDKVKPERARRYVTRWVRADVDGFARRLQVLSPGDDTQQRIGAIIDQVIRNSPAWTEQLVTLRAVQTLTIIDVAAKERLVRNLGEYQDGAEKHEAIRVKTL
jgi:hypothetical protein